MNLDLDIISGELKAIVEAELAPAVVTGFRISEDEDHEGEPVLRIEIVYEAEKDRLNPTVFAVWPDI